MTPETTGPPGRGVPGPDDGPRLGVVYDVDGVLRIAPLRRQLGRLHALATRGPRDRRSLLGMQRVLRTGAEADPDTAVFYLTALPSGLRRPLEAALRHDQYPAGTVLMGARPVASGWLFGAGLPHKRATLERLAAAYPRTSWVLVGDDAGHDPALFDGFAREHPGRVAVIALRRLLGVDDDPTPTDADGPRRVTAPNGEEMLPRLRAVLGPGRPRREPRIDDWFLTTEERGNPTTRLRAWTEGNVVRRHVHGTAYYGDLLGRLAAVGEDHQVLVLGWRTDGDQQLADDGPTVSEVLSGAARRGARVRALLWRSHLTVFGYHVSQNRRFAADLLRAGGEVLLDQRIRPLGSHHQKLVVIRHDTDATADAAYVGGIDLVLGARDDVVHRGDPQSASSGDEYTRSPRHDAQVELLGPVVRELQQVFHERWEDPSALVRLPWHVVPDLLHRLPRTGSVLPSPAPAPPPAGRCAVQVLRTYPRRRPPYPFAPRGERSVARALIKALGRAERLVYVEDQYLWSADVARVFAAALRRAPRLHLIAVVPRPEDRADRVSPAMLGQGEAMAMVHEAGGERVQVLDVENDQARPVYVHAKICIIDDVWATVGSNNFNTRSWTHDSELVAAVLDDDRDLRAPEDPAGLGDGARTFARHLRLELMREHLGTAQDADLLDPDDAARTVRDRAGALDAWHAGGAVGPRPPGRLRRHAPGHESVRETARQRWLTGPAYRRVLDPDGRSLGARLRRTY